MARGLLSMNGSHDIAAAMSKQIQADVAKEEQRIARVHTSAAKDVAAKFLNELRDDIANSGFHNAAKLSKTWRGRAYPSSGSMSPAIYMINRAPQIVDSFSLGVPIRAGNGKFLAIPLGPAVAALKRLNRPENRSRDGAGRFQSEGKTIDRVAQALGVRLHYRPPIGGKPGLLLTEAGRGRPETVLFLLVKSVNPPTRFKGRAILPTLDARVAYEFAAALARYV